MALWALYFCLCFLHFANGIVTLQEEAASIPYYYMQHPHHEDFTISPSNSHLMYKINAWLHLWQRESKAQQMEQRSCSMTDTQLPNPGIPNPGIPMTLKTTKTFCLWLCYLFCFVGFF